MQLAPSHKLAKLQHVSVYCVQTESQCGSLDLELLHSTLQQSSSSLASDLTLYIESVVAESTGLIVSRQVLTEFVSAVTSIQNAEQKRNILQSVIAVLQPRAVTFEEQISALRLMLADLLEAEEDWSDCAKVLMAIPLDSGHRYALLFSVRVY